MNRLDSWTSQYISLLPTRNRCPSYKQINRPTYACSGASRKPKPPAIVGSINSAQTIVRLFGGMYLFARAPRPIHITTSVP
jgi:hypothetical protein